jgi:hypothetical protein
MKTMSLQEAADEYGLTMNDGIADLVDAAYDRGHRLEFKLVPKDAKSPIVEQVERLVKVEDAARRARDILSNALYDTNPWPFRRKSHRRSIEEAEDVLYNALYLN